MTVAAVVVPADREEALRDASGRTAVRRIVDAAWAGGALPIVVVATDVDGRVAEALADSPARLVDPGAGASIGASGASIGASGASVGAPGAGAAVGPAAAAFRVGTEAAQASVRETSAVLLWPGRMAWVDPETVTSLIEAHGRRAETAIRPRRAGTLGWPVLLPVGAVPAALQSDAAIDACLAELETTALELGDPGTVLGLEVAFDELPDYAGPPEPVGGPPPEWGAAAAEVPDPGLRG